MYFILICLLSFIQVLAFPQGSKDFDDYDSYEDDILGFLDESYEVDSHGFLNNGLGNENDQLTKRNHENYNYNYIPLVNGKPIYIPNFEEHSAFPDIPKRTPEFQTKRGNQGAKTTAIENWQTYPAVKQTQSWNGNLPGKDPSEVNYGIPNFHGLKSPIVHSKPTIDNVLAYDENPSLNNEYIKGSSEAIRNSNVEHLEASEVQGLLQKDMPAYRKNPVPDHDSPMNIASFKKVPTREGAVVKDGESTKVVYLVETEMPLGDDSEVPVVVETLVEKPNSEIRIQPEYSMLPSDENTEQDDVPSVVEVLVQKEASDGEESPLVVEALVKKQNSKTKVHPKPVHPKPVKPVHPKPVKPVHPKPVKPVHPQPIYEYIGTEDNGKNTVHIQGKPITSGNDAESPNVVEVLLEKDIPIKTDHSFVKIADKEMAIKPVKPLESEFVYPVDQFDESDESEQVLEIDESLPAVVDIAKESEQVLDIDESQPGVVDISEESEQQPLDIVDEKEPLDDGSGFGFDERSSIDILPFDPHISSLTSNIQNQERRKFNKCVTPKNETGNCMPLQMCSVPGIVNSVEELLKNVCVIDEVFIGICCPEFPVETVRVDWGQFQEQPNSGAFKDENTTQMVKECGKIPTTNKESIPWPWMAPLVAVSTEKVFCGGALINEQYVLTAAHCTTKIPRNQILVRLGPIDSQQKSKDDFAVIEIKRHAQYNRRTMQNDIALLKLSRRVQLGDSRRFVCLPEERDGDYVSEMAILLGKRIIFGENKNLESLPVLSKQECQHKLGMSIDESVMCTSPSTEETTCNDDSGAPLVIGKDNRFKVVGLLTWNRNDCDGRFPSLFTRISSYRRWIDNHAI